jgi:hypothetical protein
MVAVAAVPLPVAGPSLDLRPGLAALAAIFFGFFFRKGSADFLSSAFSKFS